MSSCVEQFSDNYFESTCTSTSPPLKITLEGTRYDDPIPDIDQESCTKCKNECDNDNQNCYSRCDADNYNCKVPCHVGCTSNHCNFNDCDDDCCDDGYVACISKCNVPCDSKAVYCKGVCDNCTILSTSDACVACRRSQSYDITIKLDKWILVILEFIRSSDTSAYLKFKSQGNGITYTIDNANFDASNTPTVTITIDNKDLLPNEMKPFVTKGDTYKVEIYIKGTDRWYTQVTYNYTPIAPKLGSKRLVFRSARPQEENDSECPENNLRVPDIVITGQTTLDGSDISDVYFTVKDLINNSSNKCSVYCAKDNEIKTTNYTQYCPFIVCVLRGVGDSARDKLKSLKPNLDDEEFDEFYTKIITYAMLRYILIKLLTGCWNITYITNKYNKRFMCELSSSRYCEFTRFFTDPGSPIYGYSVYFK